MRKSLITPTVAGVLVMLSLAIPASANENIENQTITVPGPTITVPYKVIKNIGVGNTQMLASVNVAPKFQGLTCSAKTFPENNSSNNLNNDYLLRSDGPEVVILDVENSKWENGKSSNGTILLGSTIELWLRMGPEDVFSGGGKVTYSDLAGARLAHANGEIDNQEMREAKVRFRS